MPEGNAELPDDALPEDAEDDADEIENAPDAPFCPEPDDVLRTRTESL